MTFDAIATGAAVFLDANTLVYHFAAEPQFGPACTRLLDRIEQQDLQGYTSAHVVADMAHRLMTIEAMNLHGWPAAGLAARLRRHHDAIPGLAVFQAAVDRVPELGVHVLDVTYDEASHATSISKQYELLTGDALVVAAMQANGLTNLASNDADFDRVPGITRYAPA